MESVEASGKTVDEAIEKALAELGAERDEVEVEVLSEGKGMLGRGQAKVRVRLLDDEEDVDEDADDDEDEDVTDELDEDEDEDEDDAEELEEEEEAEEAEGDETDGEEGEAVEDEAEYAAQMLDHMLALMGIDADVSIRDAETPGDGLGMAKAVLDIEGYRRRRERQLTTLARRMADQVRRTRKAVTLEPMPANERRIIHIALADDRQVATESSGEGEERAISILPR